MLFEPAPVIWLQPKPVEQYADFQHYECPVYRTAERRGVLATTGVCASFFCLFDFVWVRVFTLCAFDGCGMYRIMWLEVWGVRVG